MQKMVKEAENAKAWNFTQHQVRINQHTIMSPTVMVDEAHIVVGAHIDQQLIEKIIKGEYIDLGKLVPRDKVISEEDNRLELVIG